MILFKLNYLFLKDLFKTTDPSRYQVYWSAFYFRLYLVSSQLSHHILLQNKFGKTPLLAGMIVSGPRHIANGCLKL